MKKILYTIINVIIFLYYIDISKGREWNEPLCLQKTRLTIFIDSKEVVKASYFLKGLSYLVTVVKNVLRDPCYQGRLYNQGGQNFIEINDSDDVLYEFDNVFQGFRYIKWDEMYSFVDKLQHNLSNGSKENMREMIFYLYDELYSLKSHWQLLNLTNQPGILLIFGCLLQEINPVFWGYDVKRFPELALIPVHRFVLISLFQNIYSQMAPWNNNDLNHMPVCFRSLAGLLLNPDYNRFEYAKRLLPETNFSKALTNVTLYFNAELDTYQSEPMEEDIDATLQLMVFLNQKLSQLKNAKFKVAIQKPSSRENKSKHLFQQLGFQTVEYSNDLAELTTTKDMAMLVFGRCTIDCFPRGYNRINTAPHILYYHPYWKRIVRNWTSKAPIFNFDDINQNIIVNVEDLLADKSLKLWMHAITSIAEKIKKGND